MQNEKASKKIESSYLVIAIFPKKHSNSKDAVPGPFDEM